MPWRVEFGRAAEKALDVMAPQPRERIERAIHRLAVDPLSAANVKRLSGREALRLRVGDYRILYTLEEAVLVVRVIALARAVERVEEGA